MTLGYGLRVFSPCIHFSRHMWLSQVELLSYAANHFWIFCAHRLRLVKSFRLPYRSSPNNENLKSYVLSQVESQPLQIGRYSRYSRYFWREKNKNRWKHAEFCVAHVWPKGWVLVVRDRVVYGPSQVKH